MREKLDLSTLSLDPNSYIDNKLAESFSDIVYSCSVDNNSVVKISLLFEHKSSPDPFPYMQLLKYMANIWEQMRKQNQEPRIVVLIIVYHGKKRWRKRDITSYLGLPEKVLRIYKERIYVIKFPDGVHGK